MHTEAPPSNLANIQANKGQPAPQNTASLGQSNAQPMMNNGSRDTNTGIPITATTSDVQKLQQQLQDIKDQVRRDFSFLNYILYVLTIF